MRITSLPFVDGVSTEGAATGRDESFRLESPRVPDRPQHIEGV